MVPRKQRSAGNRLNPFEIRASLKRRMAGVSRRNHRLNPFEIRASLKLNGLTEYLNLVSLNPFEIRASLKPESDRNRTLLSVLIPLKSGQA